jgi:hypothetical protein
MFFFSLSRTKEKDNEGLHGKGMNDINLPTCFVYILLRVGVPPPKLGLKHKVYWYLYKIVSYFYYNYLSNVYSMYTI